jgi:hypothetical protein
MHCNRFIIAYHRFSTHQQYFTGVSAPDHAQDQGPGPCASAQALLHVPQRGDGSKQPAEGRVGEAAAPAGAHACVFNMRMPVYYAYV